ncbi:PROTEIN SLOW GREEN 1 CHLOROPLASTIC [Salix purpurea]|uniref:PROTEIN SLOW GREEN 1 CHLOROPLASTIC n=1 Tax=Salix purpurea TaxID=77065 RepID=A0A9Q0UA24_SALPP|nr:PROTEIN SLOW GREEN 1 CHLOROPLASTIC [Salix purpurea]
MNSTLATYFLHLKTPSSFNLPSLHHSTTLKSHNSTCTSSLKIPLAASSSSNHNSKNPLTQTLKTLAKTAILIGVAASIAGKFPVWPAKAETPAALTERNPTLEEEQEEEDIEKHQNQNQSDPSTPLQAFLESNAEAIESLNSLLQQKLENGQDEEALKIVKLLVAAQPEVTEWKFLMARLLNEMGRAQDARNVFEEILVANPLSFEALFENALLMDRFGEGEAVIRRLQEALDIAEEENKVKEARDVRLIMAQIHFLQKSVEEALKSYQELSKEDPKDFRPYFCRGMIYSLLDRNEEAKQQFAKYRELSPKKFEVEGVFEDLVIEDEAFWVK